MKLIYLEIVLRLEDYLNKELKNTNYKNYEVVVCGNDETREYELLEKGLVYDTICFINGDEKINKNSDNFWNIIKSLEQKRTIKLRLEKMVNYLEKTKPELFNEEMPELFIGGTNEWIIYVAFILVILVIIFNPEMREQSIYFFNNLFK